MVVEIKRFDLFFNDKNDWRRLTKANRALPNPTQCARTKCITINNTAATPGWSRRTAPAALDTPPRSRLTPSQHNWQETLFQFKVRYVIAYGYDVKELPILYETVK